MFGCLEDLFEPILLNIADMSILDGGVRLVRMCVWTGVWKERASQQKLPFCEIGRNSHSVSDVNGNRNTSHLRQGHRVHCHVFRALEMRTLAYTSCCRQGASVPCALVLLCL